MTPKAFYYLNSNLVRLSGLRNTVTGNYIDNTTGVTVSMALTPSVAGGSINLNYVPGSNGVWQGVYPTTVGVQVGRTYNARITADGGSFLTGRWNVKLVVQERLHT